MRKGRFTLLIISLALAIPVKSIAMSHNDFKYYAELGGPVKENTLYKVHLSDEILIKAASGLADIRLFDDSGSEIPYVIIDNLEMGERMESYPLEVTDYTDGPDLASLTLKMPDRHLPISVIDLNISNRDFKKGVELYGSHDAARWESLSKGLIYDFSSQVNLRKSRIRFDSSDYRYYKINLISSAPATDRHKAITLRYEGLEFSAEGATDKKLRILNVTGQTTDLREKSVSYDSHKFTGFKVAADKEGNSIIDIEADLPADKISLDIENPYYYRTIKVYSSDTGKEGSYRLVNQGDVYNFPLSGFFETKNHIESNAPKCRHYRLVIINRDSPPLTIKGITFEWVQKNLFFASLSNNPRYTLRVGGSDISRPEYDLSRFVTQGNWHLQRHEDLAVSLINSNPGYKSPLSRDKKARIEKLALSGTVILLVVALGIWLYQLMGKMPDRTE